MNRNLIIIIFGISILILAVLYGVTPKAKPKSKESEARSYIQNDIETTRALAAVMKDPVETELTVEKVVETETEAEVVYDTDVELIEIFFDVPLSDDLQRYIFALCAEYGLDPAIVFAVIERESSYKENTVGDNGEAFGLMQIQPKWHAERMERLGVWDLMNPYQNIHVGVDYLAEMYELGEYSTRFMLMAYNGGPDYAERKMRDQEISEYARAVIEISRTLERKEVK